MSYATGGMVPCRDCGVLFYREGSENWKIRCIPCFKKRKEAEQQPQPQQPASNFWQKRAEKLEADNMALEKRIEQQAKTIRVLTTNLDAKPTNSGLDREIKEHLRALIQYCHPDKHGGSQGATQVTQWLNDVKRRLPCG